VRTCPSAVAVWPQRPANATYTGATKEVHFERIQDDPCYDVGGEGPPACPECGEPMPYYGGSAGYIHCESKILYNQGGWFDSQGLHIKDDRLAGGRRRVDGLVQEIKRKQSGSQPTSNA
jgi:hypothetical protein